MRTFVAVVSIVLATSCCGRTSLEFGACSFEVPPGFEEGGATESTARFFSRTTSDEVETVVFAPIRDLNSFPIEFIEQREVASSEGVDSEVGLYRMRVDRSAPSDSRQATRDVSSSLSQKYFLARSGGEMIWLSGEFSAEWSKYLKCEELVRAD